MNSVTPPAGTAPDPDLTSACSATQILLSMLLKTVALAAVRMQRITLTAVFVTAAQVEMLHFPKIIIFYRTVE